MPLFGVVCCFSSWTASAVDFGSWGFEPDAGMGGGREPNGALEEEAAASDETEVECSERRGARKAGRQFKNSS